MAFKIYFNKKTRHPSISLSGKEAEKWENMEMTHHPTKSNSYIEINIVSNNCSSKSFVRKYVRRDNHGVRGKPYSNLKLDEPSENKVSCYLKNKKKRWWQSDFSVWFSHLRASHHLVPLLNHSCYLFATIICFSLFK